MVAFTSPVLLLAGLIPVATAHMAMWHESMYGFDQSYEPVTPLANKGFDAWWFHGFANDRPSAVMSLNAGSSVTVEIACRKDYTSYGSNSGNDACPGDSGAFHAGGSTGSGSGWSGNSEANLLGCALAIAYKPTASQTRPEDFTVMSVQENCVRQRDTTFQLPANLPNCPEGGCTCAWFWQGKNSADEMYMIGFRCDVKGGVATTNYPRPAPPRRNAISGPTQPMYWANSNSNLDYKPDWGTKPSYNSNWGWKNGAQTEAFGGAGGGGAGTGTGGGSGTGNGNGNGNGNGSGNTPSSSRGRPASSTAAPPAASSPSWGGNDDDDASEGNGSGNGDWTPPQGGPSPTPDEGKTPSSSSSSRRHRPTGNNWHGNNGDWQGNGNGNGDGNGNGGGRWNETGNGNDEGEQASSGEGRPSWYNHAAMPTPSESTSSSAAAATPTPTPSPSPSPAPVSPPTSPPKKCKANKRRRNRLPHGI